MTGKLDWRRDGLGWPQHEQSRFVDAGGLRWRVVVMGDGPVALLIHGAGASAHSWRDVAPLLARSLTVVAPDLPGHGFTQTPPARGLSLPGMAQAIAEMMAVLGLSPQVIVGHSAGAAIGLRLVADGLAAPRAIVAFNGALKPFSGAAGQLFPMLARLLFLNPIAPHVFAARARWPGAVKTLIRQIGSRLDDRGLCQYEQLFRSAGHIAATLGMMAAWDLAPLRDDLARIAAPVTLITARKDRAVPPEDAVSLLRDFADASLIDFGEFGHLAHEEQPDRAAQAILAALEAQVRRGRDRA